MSSKRSSDAFAKIGELLNEAEQEVHKSCGILAQIGREGSNSAKLLAQAKSRYGDISSSIKRAKSAVESIQSEATHWRGQFLMSQIDMVTEIDRAEKAEKKLSEAIVPLPYDEQRLAEERDLGWLAFTDPITKLGNANKLDLELKKSVEKSFSSGVLTLLFVIDIDKFRTINEFGSWGQGNDVLRELSQRLSKNIPQGTVVVRRAEDEFAMVICLDKGELGESPMVQARQIADFILKLISEPLAINNQPFPITASIGISCCPDDADSAVELLENAYSSLMVAKARGGNRYVIYNDSVYTSKEDRARLASELKQALESNEISSQFRPVVDVQKGYVGAAIVEPEWHHPAHGRLQQDQFMSLAEDHGLMLPLVKQIIESGCELSRKMKGSIPIIMRLPKSVLNLHGFEKTVMEMVGKARIRPESLVIELPGECVIESPAPLTRVFRELGKWGLKGAVGLGESTPVQLGGLHLCSVSILHLSADLMGSVPAQEQRRAVVQSYLDAANRLGLSLLANGVTENSQGHFLALHGCTLAAGDFLSPSLNLAEFVKRRRTTWRLK
jgi:diguanylate cyclase (GGDEF)-like protein